MCLVSVPEKFAWVNVPNDSAWLVKVMPNIAKTAITLKGVAIFFAPVDFEFITFP